MDKLRYKSQGFTLIEVIVSMSLLLMVLMLGNWSFSIFANKWQGRLGHFEQQISAAKDLIMFQDVVSGISPYLVKGNRIHYFFQGEKLGFQAVTANPIYHTDANVAVKFEIKKDTNGLYYLLYQEGEFSIIDEEHTPVFTHQKVLISDAKSLSFSYFGWENANDYMMQQNTSTDNSKWFSNYNSASTLLLPRAIKLNFNGQDIVISLVDERGKWITSMTTSGALYE